MKNAIKYGLIIGVLSGLWIILMHILGVYNESDSGPQGITWMEYLSILIPFFGLYFGIKNYRDHIKLGRMEFFEGLMEGFKIIIVGFVLYAGAIALYLDFVEPASLKIDYMQRVGAAGIVGILFNLVVSLLLMNKQRNL